jgi:hypothetical protein
VLLHYQGGFTGAIHLAVCNPLAGTCDVLPPLNNTATGTFFDRGGCAIVTGADLSSQEHQDPLPGYSTFFKVLICVNQDVWLNGSEHISCGHLHMFSSNESSWTKPRECFTEPYLKDLKMVG